MKVERTGVAGEVLISGDRDLLDLAPLPGLRIVSPAEVLSVWKPAP